jgi:Cdc6-like AAA superfamily ATPase
MLARVPRNPFPQQASVSIESDRGDMAKRDRRRIASLALAPIQELFSAVKGYLADHAERREGPAVVLRGPHGSGKTHTVRHVLRAIEQETASTPASKPVVLSVQLNGPDQITVLRRLLDGFTLEVIRRIRLGHRAAVASDQLRSRRSPHEGLQEGARQAIESLASEPERVLELEDHYDVSRDVVDNVIGREVAGVARRQPEFRSAFQYADHQELGPEVLRWLQGASLGADVERRIGVSGPLGDQDELSASLTLLVALCHRAGLPAVVFVDQFEKLVFDAKQVVLPDLKALRTILFDLPQVGGMVVLAGSDVAWNVLPEDVRQRLKPEIVFKPLTVDETGRLIHAYIACVAEGNVSLGDVFPPDAILEVIRHGSGNPRRMLQICHAAFKAAGDTGASPEPGGPVPAALVREAAEKQQGVRLDRRTVLLNIERIVLRCGLTFERGAPEDLKVKADFAIPRGSPRVLVLVKEAMFHPDEARHALETLETIEAAASAGLSVAVVLVVIGYASREVAALLEGVVHEYLVYEPDTFEPELAARLLKLVPPERAGVAVEKGKEASGAPPSRPAVARARGELQDMIERRESETRVLDRRLVEMQELRSGLPELAAWRQAKAALENEIDLWRQRRRKSEMEEVVSAARRAEGGRRLGSTILLALAIVFVLGALAAFAEAKRPNLVGSQGNDLHDRPRSILEPRSLVESVMLEDRYQSLRMLAWSLLAASAGALMLAWWRFGFPMMLAIRYSLPDVTASPETIEQLARSLPTGPRGLRDWNPLVRYGAALQARGEGVRVLPRLLLRESSPPVRRAMIRSLDRSFLSRENTQFHELLPKITQSDWPYMIERLAKELADEELPQILREVPAPMRTLMAIYGRTVTLGTSSLVGQLFAGPLNELFESGISEADSVLIARLPLRALQHTVDELSPFEEGGLASFDHLQRRKEIAEYYLFFKQLLFLREGAAASGKPALPPVKAAAVPALP